jgi:hypothetical protein
MTDREVAVDVQMYQESNLLRVVNWRWQLARELAENKGTFFPKSIDKAVQAGRRFWHLWTNCKNEADQNILARRMPVVYQAFRLYQDSQRVSRNAVEALVLAGESPEGIAQKSGTSPEVVQAYEKLFFDVRDYLQSPDYIFNQAIGPRLRGAGPWSYDIVWKFFGYVGGVVVLEELMDTRKPGARPTTLKEAGVFLTAHTKELILRRMAIMARSLPAEDPSMGSIFVSANARSGKDAIDEETAFTTLERHIAAMVEEIPWMTGDTAKKQLPANVLDFDESAAELRADELHLLAAGRETPEMAEVKDLKMPPPKPRGEKLGGAGIGDTLE